MSMKVHSVVLPSKRYFNAPESDLYFPVEPNGPSMPLPPTQWHERIKFAELAQLERSNSLKYRFSGNISCFSFLNRSTQTPLTYPELDATFINPIQTEQNDPIANFDLKLGRIVEYKPLGNGYYQAYWKIEAIEPIIQLIPSGFSRNPYGETVLSLLIDRTFDISNWFATGLENIPTPGIPVTETILILSPKIQYQPQLGVLPSGWLPIQDWAPTTVRGYRTPTPTELTNMRVAQRQILLPTPPTNLPSPSATWVQLTNIGFDYYYGDKIRLFCSNADRAYTASNLRLNAGLLREYLGLPDPRIQSFPVSTLVTGSIIPGDVYFWDPSTFSLILVWEQKFRFSQPLIINNEPTIRTRLDQTGLRYISQTNTLEVPLIWESPAAHRWVMKTFSAYPEEGDPTTTAGIPDWAANITPTQFVWKDLLTPGYIEPDSEKGVSYPFVNGVHYLHQHISHPIIPQLGDPNTFRLFSSAIWQQNFSS